MDRIGRPMKRGGVGQGIRGSGSKWRQAAADLDSASEEVEANLSPIDEIEQGVQGETRALFLVPFASSRTRGGNFYADLVRMPHCRHRFTHLVQLAASPSSATSQLNRW